MTTKSQSHTVPLGELRHARRSRVSLVFYAREGDRTVTLSPGENVVVGRSSPAELQILDSSLSREHARLSVLEDSSLEIEDLDSSNGTFLNGQRIEEAAIVAPGDQLELGGVMVGVHMLAAGAKRLTGLLTHDAFIKQLEDEVTRGLAYGRPLAVALLRADGHVDRVVPDVLEGLRRIDKAARYSDDTLELLLPEMSQLDAQQALTKVCEGAGGVLRVAFTSAPAGGRTAMELHARAKAAIPSAPGLACGDRELAGKADAGSPLIVDEKMRRLYDNVERAAQSTIPVLVHGETGSGKELVARQLHEQSGRDGELVCVNCGAIPESLLTSTLFGAEKGAFTGADQRKAGIFESADKGTVFLDEIGELPESAQAALLRVLENRTITRVGGTREIPVDVRIVAATHRDLEEMVEEGQFREDLLYRLNALTMKVPPLRERPADITALTERFLQEVGGLRIGEDAMAALHAYHWPGNVRELRNAIDRAAVLARGPTITFLDLPDRVRGGAGPASSMRANTATLGGGAPAAPFKTQLRNEERRILLDALRRAEGVQKDAAELLAMPLRTFVYKLKQLGIRRKKSGYEIDDA